MADISKSDRDMVHAAADIIARNLKEDGEKLIVRGFGTFKRVTKKARTARNPKTGAAVQVPAKSLIKFTAAKTA